MPGLINVHGMENGGLARGFVCRCRGGFGEHYLLFYSLAVVARREEEGEEGRRRGVVMAVVVVRRRGRRKKKKKDTLPKKKSASVSKIRAANSVKFSTLLAIVSSTVAICVNNDRILGSKQDCTGPGNLCFRSGNS